MADLQGSLSCPQHHSFATTFPLKNLSRIVWSGWCSLSIFVRSQPGFSTPKSLKQSPPGCQVRFILQTFLLVYGKSCRLISEENNNIFSTSWFIVGWCIVYNGMRWSLPIAMVGPPTSTYAIDVPLYPICMISFTTSCCWTSKLKEGTK
jgi:hypothetical protein